ncbi:MAG TPA: CheR family methyltransferase [Geobacteraceae bacterium]|nr:CheR family methyltransferase [Geobacteraceae bacterium]
MEESSELNGTECSEQADKGGVELASHSTHDRPPLTAGEMHCGVYPPCFVVGIGASAGGQGPLEHIFTAVPADCDLAYVVIMHFPAGGPSYLADLLRRYTPMEVRTAEDDTPLLPNTVYVIPPGAELTVSSGRLRVNSRTAATAGLNHLIDRFFTSLAADCGDRAIALVLSGFGMDGAEGVKRIKENGGIVLVQAPETAVNSHMPENAIVTGATDMILAIEEIPVKLAEIARGHCSLTRKSCLTTTVEEELQAIFALVRERTGNDFSSYKKNTVMRRIERRMTVNESGGLRKYLAFLEETPREAEALAQEILIGVTRFFRDGEAFEALASELIPGLFANRDPGDPVRIWHACCATGEEAYSVAMLVRERLERERFSARVQIFATDIDEAAIAEARAGFYTGEIGADVGEERLRNFFTRCNGRWQVVKELREMILFASHNIIKDPPFSRLDLLVCRNFLIYLNPDMQKRLISLFHMVLKPGGYLFLGSAESVGNNSELFAPLDKKWKIYQRLDGIRRDDALFPFTTPSRKLTRPPFPRPATGADEPTPAEAADKVIVERYSLPCVVVNENYEVLHISSRTSPYLEVPVGAPALDILKMAREELRPALRAAIYKVFTEGKKMVFRGVKLADDDAESLVNVTVELLNAHSSYGRLALVVLQPAPLPAAYNPPAGGETPAGDDTSRDALIRQLEEQLRITHEQLLLTTEQLETSNEGFMATNEELMSINEEFQSANEELQSTNEELEASKEELQALNEELVTVNAELQGKVEELDQANSDMENLFASSGIATIFLDPELIIKRFSPVMAAILNLIPADIGRPFRHLSGTIDWSGLAQDARTVLEELAPIEREVASVEDGRCFIMRVLPYRTSEGKIDGVVVTLVDISERKRAEEEIRSAALFPLENPAPVLRMGQDESILFANRSAESMLEKLHDGSGMKPAPFFHCVGRSIDSGEPGECEIDVSGRTISFIVVPFPERGYANLYGRDITDKKQAVDAANRAKAEWERTFDSVPDLIAILDDKHRIVRVNRALSQRLGVAPDECIGLPCYRGVHGSDGPPTICPHVKTMADGMEHAAELRVDSFGGDFLVSTTPLLDENGNSIGAVHVARDITEQKKAEEELHRHVDELERFNHASVGRELRMIELKKEVNELCNRAGEKPRYELEFADE